MQLGEFELTTISGGRYRIDGGTMFGVVPQALWNKTFPPDDKNLIAQATNCVLVQNGRQKVLIDTGYGSKLTEKQRKIFQSEEGDPLVASLAEAGVSVEEIDTVIFSHLHFDHAGGATQRTDEGRLVTTFPNAEYVAQRFEWETATAEFPELRGAYPLDNILPLEEADQLRLVEGEVEIVSGVWSLVTGGHTAGHQALLISSGGETAVYLGDLCPTSRHLATLWCMAYDVDLLEVRRRKPEILERAADNGWWTLLGHDPDHAAIQLCRDERRDFAVSEALVEL